MLIDARRSPELKTLPLRIIIALAMMLVSVSPALAGGEPTERPGAGNPLNQAARYCLALARAIMGGEPGTSFVRRDSTSSQQINSFTFPGEGEGSMNLSTWYNTGDTTLSLFLLEPGVDREHISTCLVVVGPEGTAITTQKSPKPLSRVVSPDKQFGQQLIRDLQDPYKGRK